MTPQHRSQVSQMIPAAPHSDMVDLYDRLAPNYDRLHRRWLRHAGGEAQAALEATIRALATPNTKLLDAGCGTGAFARALIAEGIAPAHMTLLDPSNAMLAHCTDLPARQIEGRLEAMPFEDGEFDIVTCAWALETVSRPDLAISELCRVIRPGGKLCIAYCADVQVHFPTVWLMRQAITWRGTGRFLCPRFVAKTIESHPGFKVRSVPCSGPVAALIARRMGMDAKRSAHRCS